MPESPPPGEIATNREEAGVASNRFTHARADLFTRLTTSNSIHHMNGARHYVSRRLSAADIESDSRAVVPPRRHQTALPACPTQCRAREADLKSLKRRADLGVSEPLWCACGADLFEAGAPPPHPQPSLICPASPRDAVRSKNEGAKRMSRAL
jgi:hypothetical protein